MDSSHRFLGWLNERHNPNCNGALGCRDRYGHFCSEPVTVFFAEGDDGTAATRETDGRASSSSSRLVNLTAAGGDGCASEQGICDTPASGWAVAAGGGVLCPSTCQDCIGWESDARALWTIVLLMSLVSPALVWLCLPFLRGERDGATGVLACDARRLRGACGRGEKGVDDADEGADEGERRPSAAQGNGGGARTRVGRARGGGGGAAQRKKAERREERRHRSDGGGVEDEEAAAMVEMAPR